MSPTALQEAPPRLRVRMFNTYETSSPMMRDLVRHLAVLAHDCEVVLSAAPYRSARCPLEDAVPSSVRVARAPVGPGRPGKARVIGTFMFSAAIRSLFGRGTDLNLFFTHPPLYAALGLLLRWFRGQPFFIVVMDLYPNVAVEAGLLKSGSLPARLLGGIARRTLRGAAGVIAIGRCMEERLLEYGVAPERIRVIPNWSDTPGALATDAEVAELRRELDLAPDAMIVLYAGNMGVSHMFEAILEAADRLRDEVGVHFLMVGAGVRRAQLAEAVERDGLDNVTMLPYQPSERVRVLFRLADVHYVCLRPGFEGLVVPSKAYSAMASGRGLLFEGSASSEIARLIQENDVGWVVPPNDPLTLETTLRAMCEAPDAVRASGDRALDLSRTEFAIERHLHAFTEFLTEDL